MTVRRLTAQCLPPLRNKRNSTGDCHAAEFQNPRTSSLGAARPLPPSADIGPGGQSVGQAAQFCLVTLLRAPLEHRAWKKQSGLAPD